MPSLKIHNYWCEVLFRENGWKEYVDICYELNREIDFGIKHDMYKGSVANLAIGYLRRVYLEKLEKKALEKITRDKMVSLTIYLHHVLDLLRDLLYVVGYETKIFNQYKEQIIESILDETREKLIINIDSKSYTILREFIGKHYVRIIYSIMKYRRNYKKYRTTIWKQKLLSELLAKKLLEGKFNVIKILVLSRIIDKISGLKLKDQEIAIIHDLLMRRDDESNNRRRRMDNVFGARYEGFTSDYKVYKKLIKYRERALEAGYVTNNFEAEVLAYQAISHYYHDRSMLEKAYHTLIACTGEVISIYKFFLNMFLKAVKKELMETSHKPHTAYAVTAEAIHYLVLCLVRGTTIRIPRKCIEALVCSLGYCYKDSIDEAINDILFVLKQINREENT